MFHRIWQLWTLVGIVFLSACSGGPGPSEAAEIVLLNGNILTVDADFSTAEALAVSGGRILAVGSNQEIENLVVPNTQRIDLAGNTVIPGLADNHFHWAGGGLGVDLSRVRSMDELLGKIKERVENTEPGELVMTNGDWHEAQLQEQRLPLRRDLDTVATDNPVVVVRGGHEFILNSAALKKWNISKDTPVPEGGRITRYPDGELNGELVDKAKALVKLPPPPEKDQESQIQEQLAQHRKLHAAGLTSIRHPGAPIEQFRALQEIQKRGQLKMRVNFLVRLFGVQSVEDVVEAVESWGVQMGEGDEWLQIGGVKLGVDGGFEGGWMREPYAEPWDRNGTFYGLQTMSQDRYNAIVAELARRGWRVATHAVGDAAIDQVLEGYESTNQETPLLGQRWVIEHGFIPAQDHFPRINALGVSVSAQNHLYVAGPSLEKYWGRERAEWVTPLRSYLDNQVQVSLGTDAPVIPYPPLWVIYHFVSRDTITGGVFGADQKVSREEVLRAITQANAYLTFEEDLKGSLEPGKFADLVVLSENLMTCPEEKIRDASVLLTLVNGEIVHRHPDFPAD